MRSEEAARVRHRSKGVAFFSSSRASSSFVTAAVDEAVEKRVMETNERIAVMET